MSSFPLLNIIIAMVFVYLLLSLICSALKELIEAKWKKRSSTLRQGIETLLGSEWATKLYGHGLIKGLYQTGSDPSYIPAKTFATALYDLMSAAPDLPTPLAQSLEAIKKQAGADVSKIETALEDWYNAGMDRVSGWYKRHTQWVLVAIGCVLTIAMNVDSVQVAEALSQNPQLAAEVSDAAARYQGDNKTLPTTTAREGQKQLTSLGIPIGWDGQDRGRTAPWRDLDKKWESEWYQQAGYLLGQHWAGWLITMIAVSFGAPFWFDLLNRFMVVRSTVKPEEKSPDEASKS